MESAMKELEEKLEALKKIKDTEPSASSSQAHYDEMKKKMEEMNQVAQKIGTAMYQQQSASAQGTAADKQAGAQPGSEAGKTDEKKDEDKKSDGEEQNKGKDEPVEGEFEEKK